MSLEEVERAEVLGAEMLQAMSPSQSKELDEAKDLRQRAGEHLRRGIDQVRAAALYIFRDDEAMLERYPSLFVLRRRRRSGDTDDDEASASTGEGPSTPQPEVGETSVTTDDQSSQVVDTPVADA